MRIDDLRYLLKPENIACEPPDIRLGRRDFGKLLVVDRVRQELNHSNVFDLPKWLLPGDVLVLNNSKRMPGELKGRIDNGAQVDLRFAGLDSDHIGLCRIYPMHFIQTGVQINLEDGRTLRVLESRIPPHGLCRVESEGYPLREFLHAVGLPITSFFSQGYWKLENYNNFYATEEGSIESPMAGLHFTPELLEAVKQRGVEVVFITLHSVGSWLPFLEEDVADHEMLPENYVVPAETAQAINNARERGGRIVACGSTVVRTLETVGSPDHTVSYGSGQTNLFISPGFHFRVVDVYFTNFHTYRSSLMVLDASFCEKELLMYSYRQASEMGYLFHEFGDAVMYI